MNEIRKLQEIFAERVKDLLQERNINRNELSRETGIPKTSISGWLNLKRAIQIDSLCKIALFFGVSTDYLLGLED